jgi:D-sedoheptulose 7-phosphate isomerase
MRIEDIKRTICEINTDDLNKLNNLILSRDRIIILGNGGSNALASHICQDYTKVLGKKAISFSDSSRLSCYMNDYGVENAYVKFIEHFFENGTLVILISSSGNSPNIVNSAKFCIDKKIDMVTLSGFDRNNKLNLLSDYSLINFWVDSGDYGVVECTHEIILHSVV